MNGELALYKEAAKKADEEANAADDEGKREGEAADSGPKITTKEHRGKAAIYEAEKAGVKPDKDAVAKTTGAQLGHRS